MTDFGVCVLFLQFGRAIVCSDAAAEAARYGFTAVDRPEGFLVLAVASLGEEILEFSSPPEVPRYYLDFSVDELFLTNEDLSIETSQVGL